MAHYLSCIWAARHEIELESRHLYPGHAAHRLHGGGKPMPQRLHSWVLS